LIYIKKKCQRVERAKKIDNKAYCNICSDDVNNKLSYVDGSTGAISNYLSKIYGLHPQRKQNKLINK